MFDCFRFNSDTMQTAEFTEEMDDLFFWLDEAESFVNMTPRPADEENLEDLLDKVKVYLAQHKPSL